MRRSDLCPRSGIIAKAPRAAKSAKVLLFPDPDPKQLGVLGASWRLGGNSGSGRALLLVAAFVAFHAPALAAAQGKKPPVACTEHVPPGATKPEMKDSFPTRGFAGYAQPLSVTVKHGNGETVLPDGFKVVRGTEAAKALELAGFAIPEPDGGIGPSVATETSEAGSVTQLVIPVLALPPGPGKIELTLPPLPIAVSRASGELVTLCTAPHAITIEEPIANLANPKVMPSPDPRPQREEWVVAKYVTFGALAALVLAVLLAWLWRKWASQPKVVPVPPPRLPWVVALEELEELENSALLSEGKLAEYFDRVSDCVRRYLGARYGFDGLETTSDEMRALLRRVRPPVGELGTIAAFLSDCDLVKFARRTPTADECREARTRGERIVKKTIPPDLDVPPVAVEVRP